MFNIKVVGIDMAFANMGLCSAVITNNSVLVNHLKLVSTKSCGIKTVRKNSDDLTRAKELLTALTEFCEGATIAFVEVPHGSQSARASWSLGIAIGVLASCSVPLIQVTALEVKKIVGDKKASKQQVIEWSVNKHPNAAWLRHGKKLIAANEHLADAIACIYAGIQTDEFERMVAVLVNPNQPRMQRRSTT